MTITCNAVCLINRWNVNSDDRTRPAPTPPPRIFPATPAVDCCTAQPLPAPLPHYVGLRHCPPHLPTRQATHQHSYMTTLDDRAWHGLHCPMDLCADANSHGLRSEAARATLCQRLPTSRSLTFAIRRAIGYDKQACTHDRAGL